MVVAFTMISSAAGKELIHLFVFYWYLNSFEPGIWNLFQVVFLQNWIHDFLTSLKKWSGFYHLIESRGVTIGYSPTPVHGTFIPIQIFWSPARCRFIFMNYLCLDNSFFLVHLAVFLLHRPFLRAEVSSVLRLEKPGTGVLWNFAKLRHYVINCHHCITLLLKPWKLVLIMSAVKLMSAFCWYFL